MTDRRALTVAIFCHVALFGALLQLRGALLPTFGDHFAVSEGRLGLLATVGSLGLLVAVLAVGGRASRLRAKRVLLVGLVVVAAVVAAVAAAPTYPVLLAGFLALGLAQGCLNGIDRPLLSHLYPASRGRVYNRQEMVWAVGAALGPVLATAALAVSGWRLAYAILALAFVPLALAVSRLEVPTLANERVLEVGGIRDLLAVPAVGTMGGLLFLLSLVESGLFTWLPYYLDGVLPRAVANLSLSVFLASYVPGRYAFSVAADRFDNLALVLASACCATVALAGFLLVDGYASLALVFVVGLLVSGLFPTLLAWATNAAPEYSGPINALAFASSGTGFMVFPAFMGVIAEYAGIDAAMGAVVLAMGVLSIVAGGRLFVRNARRRGAA